MKSTGIVRKIDDLGRMVIPIELRKTMNINKKDPMEIFVDEEKIILKKYIFSLSNFNIFLFLCKLYLSQFSTDKDTINPGFSWIN